MLTQLFPKSFDRFRSLPLVGPIADDFATWLLQQGYQQSSARLQLRAVVRIDGELRKRGLLRLEELTHEKLLSCSPANSQDDRILAGTVHALERFLEGRKLLPQTPAAPPTPLSTLVAAYAEFLRGVRAFAPSTIREHVRTASQFLEHVAYESLPSWLARLSPNDVELFVRSVAERYSRGSLQHVVAHLRGFLRFLTTKGLVPGGLDSQIDTPRLYRFEQLPRALSWETVRAFLHSIDRTKPLGLRDHTMFFLMATYGLRPCEIVALTLEDIHWRQGWFQVSQRKTGSTLSLPLTDAVGSVLLHYLRQGRPSSPRRELFLRARAPVGPLKPTAVTGAFHAWSRRSGLDIPFQGSHCLRHSYAIHLLRRGTSLKTIGDLLGHRTAESTCAYLRLAVEDLRDVALPVPQENLNHHNQEVHP
ncbi:site-specific integrase [Acidobacteria bacterium AH-259-G07]|nr:site-specific integrase [Acidobacteria bacterium AH-259-G07]